MAIYKCENCESTNVERKIWTKLNTQKYVEEVSDGEPEDNWCPDCETHCRLIIEDDEDIISFEEVKGHIETDEQYRKRVIKLKKDKSTKKPKYE